MSSNSPARVASALESNQYPCAHVRRALNLVHGAPFGTSPLTGESLWRWFFGISASVQRFPMVLSFSRLLPFMGDSPVTKLHQESPRFLRRRTHVLFGERHEKGITIGAHRGFENRQGMPFGCGALHD